MSKKTTSVNVTQHQKRPTETQQSEPLEHAKRQKLDKNDKRIYFFLSFFFFLKNIYIYI